MPTATQPTTVPAPPQAVPPPEPRGYFVPDSQAQAPAKPAFTVIVPCYNEEHAIRETIATLRRTIPHAEQFELLVVNDGSTDGSAEILRTMEAADPHLRVLHHTRNRGYGAALKSAIRQATTEYIVITDADGTYPNERIPELLSIARQRNADMIVGARTSPNVTYPLIRKIPKTFLRTYASWLAGREIPDLNSGLRVFRRSVAERFLHILPDGFSFTTTITLAMLTNHHHVHYVPIAYATRIGRSKIRPIRDTINFVQLIVRTGTYFAPLRVFFPISMVLFALFGLSAVFDVFVLHNLTDKTILFLLFAMNTGMFALLADMIHKRGLQ